MRRRGFIGLLASVAATATLDPEFALWKSSAKLISIPRAQTVVTFGVGDIITIGGRYRVDPRTRMATDDLMRFVVTRKVDSQNASA